MEFPVTPLKSVALLSLGTMRVYGNKEEQPEAFYNVDEANTYLSLAPEKISLTSSAVLSLFTH